MNPTHSLPLDPYAANGLLHLHPLLTYRAQANCTKNVFILTPLKVETHFKYGRPCRTCTYYHTLMRRRPLLLWLTAHLVYEIISTSRFLTTHLNQNQGNKMNSCHLTKLIIHYSFKKVNYSSSK